MTNVKRPNLNSESEKELQKVDAQFEKFDAEVKEMTQDRMNATPKEDVEPQTKISQIDLAKKKDIYLKPIRSIGSREKFNEKYRAAYEYDKEYVHFIAENKELIGETIDIWSKPYAGMPAEEWLVPTNKPVWAPRYLAEQIKRKYYHRLVMKDMPSSSEGNMQFYGSMSVDTTIARLDASPVSTSKSIFMSSNAF
jgi:hypothetical protein